MPNININIETFFNGDYMFSTSRTVYMHGTTASEFWRIRDFANTKDIFSVTGDGKVNMDYGFSITGGSVVYNMYVNSGSDTFNLRDITNGQNIFTITPTFTILGNRIYLPDTPAGATSTALFLDGSNGVTKRTLGSNAFSSESYLKDTTDTLTGVLTVTAGTYNLDLYENDIIFNRNGSSFIRNNGGASSLVGININSAATEQFSVSAQRVVSNVEFRANLTGATAADYGARVRDFGNTEDYFRVQGDGFTYAKKYDVSATEGYYQGGTKILTNQGTSSIYLGASSRPATVGTQQTHLGDLAGGNNGGYYTIHAGYRAGLFIADGITAATSMDECIYIGADTLASANGVSNEIVVGTFQVGKGSNTASWGNYSTLTNYFYGNIYSQLQGATTSHYGRIIRNFADTADQYKFDGTGVHHNFIGIDPLTGTGNTVKSFVDTYDGGDEVCYKHRNSNGDLIELKKVIDANFGNTVNTGDTATDNLINSLITALTSHGFIATS